jgi:hypothetical protein
MVQSLARALGAPDNLHRFAGLLDETRFVRRLRGIDLVAMVAERLPDPFGTERQVAVRAMRAVPENEGLQWRAAEALHNVYEWGDDDDKGRFVKYRRGLDPAVAAAWRSLQHSLLIPFV